MNISKTESTTYTTARDTKRGRRIWIEGNKLSAAGFTPDAPYSIAYAVDQKRIVLLLDSDGKRRVTKSTRGDKARPIIDLMSADVARVFDSNDRIRVTFRAGMIEIDQHHESASQVDREARFIDRAKNGTIQKASMFTGGGISTDALSTAIADAGIGAQMVWVADADQKYLESAGENCSYIGDDTAFLIGNVEEIEPQLFTQCDVLSLSMPCAGFAKCGASKHKKTSEAHSGTALFGVINAIKSAQPAVIVSENVVEAKGSPIYTLLIAELERSGYTVFEHVLNQQHTGSIENRNRYWFVAISKGIAPNSIQVPVVDQNQPTINSILESDPIEQFCDNKYLNDKALSDAAAGKGFKRQLLTGAETTCGSIGRFYAKKRSTEPFLIDADGKERLFTPAEHARVKSVPLHLIDGLAKTTAHEILGQSVDWLQPYNLMRQTLAAIYK